MNRDLAREINERLRAEETLAYQANLLSRSRRMNNFGLRTGTARPKSCLAGRSKKCSAKRRVSCSEPRFPDRPVFSSMVVGIALYDREGKLLSMNPAGKTILGYAAKDLANHFSERIAALRMEYSDGRPVHPEETPLGRALKGETVRDFQFRFRYANAETRWLQSNTAPIRRSEGALLGVVANFIDITERVRAEQALEKANQDLGRQAADLQTANIFPEQSLTQEQASRTELEATNRELEAFVYSISQDLRTPLNQISELSRVMLEDYGAELPEGIRPFAHLSHEHAEATSCLAEDLLTLSRVTHGSLSKVVVDMNEFVHQALTEIRAQQGRRSVDVEFADLPGASADPRLLKQVWVNLLANAFKLTQRREDARIEIGTRMQGEALVYYVKDNEAGFDTAQRGWLFRPFHRLHHADEFEGNGLGLAIVRRIVERHGGSVWAEGAVGQGAKFSFTLDRAAPGNSRESELYSQPQRALEADAAHAERNVIRVLVVDDHQRFRQGVKVLLKRGRHPDRGRSPGWPGGNRPRRASPTRCYSNGYRNARLEWDRGGAATQGKETSGAHSDAHDEDRRRGCTRGGGELRRRVRRQELEPRGTDRGEPFHSSRHSRGKCRRRLVSQTEAWILTGLSTRSGDTRCLYESCDVHQISRVNRPPRSAGPAAPLVLCPLSITRDGEKQCLPGQGVRA